MTQFARGLLLGGLVAASALVVVAVPLVVFRLGQSCAEARLTGR